VLLSLYVVIYVLGLLAAFITVREPLNSRHMSVLYVFTVLLVFYGVDRFLLRSANRSIRTLTLVAALLWCAYPISSAYQQVSLLNQSCCGGNLARSADLVQWLQANALDPGDYYSNTPLPLVYSQYPVYAAPAGIDGWPALLKPGRDVYLIWFSDPDPARVFRGVDRFYYPLNFDIEALSDLADVSLMVDLAQGQILRLRA
jgi:hypothetical protein